MNFHNLIGTVQDIDFIFAEAQILKNLNHKNVVKILNCFTLNNMQVAFVMEYLDGGELKDYVISKGHLTEEEALGFFKQLTEAVSYLHRENIIHRDLKLENILLESKESKIIKVQSIVITIHSIVRLLTLAYQAYAAISQQILMQVR